MSEPEVLPDGFEIGNYVIRACVGRGAMGSVYRAEHTLLKKQVALKIMDPVLLKSSEARQRFRREAQAAAAIQHPNVVAITDTGVTDGIPFIVMELLDGIDLDAHLQQHGPLSEEAVAALALPIVAALGVAHDSGVVHRDLKPSNIFLARGLDGELVPKVLDFGISKFSAFVENGDLAMTPFDSLMGTPLYLPPEAVHGSHAMTPLSDQYSLGVVLYECVTGKTPFEPGSLLNVLNAIARGQFEPPRKLRPGTSLALEAAILRAMSADPASRFPQIRGLGRALLEVADVRTQTLWAPTFSIKHSAADTATSPISLAARVSPKELAPSPRSSARWRSLTGVAVALLGIALIWTLSRRGPLPPAPATSAPGAAAQTEQRAPVVAVSTPQAAEPEHERTAAPSSTGAGKNRAPTPRARSAAQVKDKPREAITRESSSGVRALRNAPFTARQRDGAARRGAGRVPAPAEDDLQELFNRKREPGAEHIIPTESGADTPARNQAPLFD